MSPPVCVLTIAGSDSGAGAGIQADARTIHALGGYAVCAVTAITAQGGTGVRRWQAVRAGLVADQIAAVLEPFAVAAIKTGLLPNAAVVRAVARALGARPGAPLVVDPVMGSTSGTRFLSAPGLEALKRELLPRAALVTPNWPEAEALGSRPVRTDAQARDAARRLSGEHGCAVLVKGGHGRGPHCRDWLATPDGRILPCTGSRIVTSNTHGTGCVLSAAIATALARSAGLREAVLGGHAFLRRALQDERGLDWGAGAGPAYAGIPAHWATAGLGARIPARAHGTR
jgi:hydroxymethylpyrimidine/phosphomethylpyrimidine kinase